MTIAVVNLSSGIVVASRGISAALRTRRALTVASSLRNLLTTAFVYRAGTTTHSTFVEVLAIAAVLNSFGIVVAGRRVCTPNAWGSFTVASPWQYVLTTAFIDCAGTAANPALIGHIALAIAFSFRNARTVTYTTFIFHVAVTITGSRQQVLTTALIYCAWTSTDAALVQHIAFTVAFTLRNARPVANPALIFDIALTITGTRQNVFTTTIQHSPWTATNTTFVFDIPIAIASAIRNSRTSANTALVQHIAFAVTLT